MEYQEDNTDRKRKVRIIGMFCAITIVVLGIGAWVIVSAINSVNGGDTVETATTQEVKKAEPAKDTKEVKAEKKEESKTVATTETTATKATSEAMPSTGPASLAATALLAGASVYLLALNRNMLKNKQ